jgi:SAM-dependent methyltransferase
MSDLGAYWDARADREAEREQENPRKQVHTDLLWRLVASALPGPRCTILDAGAGTGRFSLPLARRGYRVTHLDLSTKMIEVARAAAETCGSALEFQQGDIVDLSRFADDAFDVVLCLDSPLSFCCPRQETALSELVRVCRSSLVLCVMSRLGVILEGGIVFDLKHYGRPRTVRDVFETGDLVVTEDLQRLQPMMPSWHAFTVEELEGMLAARGLTIHEIMAPAALAASVPTELLAELLSRPEDYRAYLEFEERFDAQRTVLGAASSGGGGIAVLATKGM